MTTVHMLIDSDVCWAGICAHIRHVLVRLRANAPAFHPRLIVPHHVAVIQSTENEHLHGSNGHDKSKK
jgi:hypothetical protein